MGFSMERSSGVFGRPDAKCEIGDRERVLGSARFLVAICSLSVISFRTAAFGRYTSAAHAVLLLYVVHSLILLVLVRLRPDSPGFPLTVSAHAADLLWPVLISWFTGGPNTPFFVLSAFAVVAAAYRWGAWEILATTITSAVLFLAEAAFAISGAGSHLYGLEEQFHAEAFITQMMGLLMLGGLLGFLAKREGRLQSENLAIKYVLKKADPEISISETLGATLRAILEVFGATHVSLALKGSQDGRAFLWKVGSAQTGSGILESKELETADIVRLFFPMLGKSWSLRRSGKAEHCRFLALDEEGRRGEKVSCSISENLLFDRPFRTLLMVDFRVRKDWAGRIFLCDVQNSKALEPDLRFFQRLIGEVAPAVHSAYLLRRMRSHVRSSERARIARDLHDGVIQSLITMEMRVDALRREAAMVSSGAAERLEVVRDLLRREVISLRELIRQLRFDDVEPQQLNTCIADIVDGFRRDTGIEASFFSDAQITAMPSRVSRQVVRIVHEGLANVQKHSGAHNVRVRLGAEPGLWKLVIEDDGHGFEFSGRLSLSELDLAHRGPRVIKERVHSINGELAIDSHPCRGARLEVSFAVKAYG